MAPLPFESPKAPAVQAATSEREQKDEETSRSAQQHRPLAAVEIAGATPLHPVAPRPVLRQEQLRPRSSG